MRDRKNLRDHVEPKFHRSFTDNHIGWEIYSRHVWFINIAFGTFEIQFNKW